MSSMAGLAVLSGFLGVERRAFLQAMASRPLVAAPLIGLVLGHPIELIPLGAALELFFLGAVDLGASHADNELLACCGAASCAAMTIDVDPTHRAISFALATLLFLPLARIGRYAESLSDRFNDRLSLLVTHRRPEIARLRSNLYGIWIPFVAAALASLAGAQIGKSFLVPLLAAMPEKWRLLLALLWGVFVLTAAAIAIRSIKTVRAAPFLRVAALASVAVVGLTQWLGSH